MVTKLARSLLLLAVLFGSMKRSDAAGWSFDQLPVDLDKVDIYMHTVEVGNLIFNNFGHTALRVHDQSNGRDLIFNWGIFDFNNPAVFAYNFYRGVLIYQLGIYPYRYAMERYTEERRTVWQDKLKLTLLQKRKLLERLIWNSQPANRAYAYQYFFDNCSTRPRDYIDEAIGGQFKKNYQAQFAPQTFRDFISDAYGMNPGFDLFLDIGVNSKTDRMISVWERMFHPLFLRADLLKQVNQGEVLVESSEVLIQFAKPETYQGLSYLLVFLVFGLPLTLCGISFYFRAKLASYLPYCYRAFSLFSLPLIIFGGFLGFIMPLTWLVSAHLELKHNANILLFWPLDGVLAIWLFGLLRQGQALVWRANVVKLFRGYCLLHLMGSLSMPVLRLFGVIEQNVDRVMVWVLPPYLIILFLLWRVGLGVKEEKIRS